MLEILTRTELFHGIQRQELPSLLDCLFARVRQYEKGAFIYIAGESQPLLGVILSGSAQIIKENGEGNQTIIGTVKQKELFGETFACMDLDTVEVSVRAQSETRVLFLDVKKIIGTCSKACPHHQLLIFNLLKIIAQKNAALNRKLFYMSHKTIRAKLQAFFKDMAEQTGGYEFVIPFNRSELADYLCANRSAMTRELGKMKEEGILEFSKNTFRLRLSGGS